MNVRCLCRATDKRVRYVFQTMSKETIFVGPLSAVNPTIEASGVGYLVTLINDQTMIDTPPAISPHKHFAAGHE